jgi:hypothetical protein
MRYILYVANEDAESFIILTSRSPPVGHLSEDISNLFVPLVFHQRAEWCRCYSFGSWYRCFYPVSRVDHLLRELVQTRGRLEGN